MTKKRCKTCSHYLRGACICPLPAGLPEWVYDVFEGERIRDAFEGKKCECWQPKEAARD